MNQARLLAAAERGYFLETGIDPNSAKSAKGSTAVKVAAQNGHLEAVKLLVQHSADVNLASEDGYTAIMNAAQYGHVDTVKFLVEVGADIHKASPSGQTALSRAAAFCQLDMWRAEMQDQKLQQQLEAGKWRCRSSGMRQLQQVLAHMVKGEPGMRVVMWRADMQDQKRLQQLETAVDLLAELGAKPDMNMLHLAASQNRVQRLKLFLESGIDVNLASEDGYTAIMNAAQNGHLDTVKFLVEAGADIHKASTSGQTALMIVQPHRVYYIHCPK